jgi:hypothetical protein
MAPTTETVSQLKGLQHDRVARLVLMSMPERIQLEVSAASRASNVSRPRAQPSARGRETLRDGSLAARTRAGIEVLLTSRTKRKRLV